MNRASIIRGLARARRRPLTVWECRCERCAWVRDLANATVHGWRCDPPMVVPPCREGAQP